MNLSTLSGESSGDDARGEGGSAVESTLDASPATPTTIDSFLRRVAAAPVAPPAEAPLIGPERYVERAELGHGGMGRIVVARDRHLGRPVAIKELRVPSPALRARFLRETRLTARLQHPSIVSLIDAGHWPNGEPFFVMRLVPGRSLDEVVAAAADRTARLALVANIQAVADALAYAHREGVIHRDLKPHNVLIGEFGETVVIDWGLAKDLRAGDDAEPAVASGEGDAAATLAGDVLGTPSYMPPEQAAGELVDERADVYAIGALLYYVLAGTAPYPGGSSAEVVSAVKAAAPPPLAERVEGLPPDLLAIVSRAMAREPADRYRDAGELASDLRRFLAGQLVAAHQYSIGELLRRWLRRHRATVAVATLALVALGVIAAVSIRRVLAAERQADAERQLAVGHRADAEGLLDFLLVDLRDKLEPVGKVGLLDAVAKKARDYYQTRPVVSAVDRYRRGLSRTNYADALTDQSEVDAALVEYRAGLTDLDAAVAADPTNGEWARIDAIVHIRIADLARRRSDLPVARAELDAALALLDPAVARAPTPLLRRWQLRAHGARSQVLADQGDSAAALAEARTAETLAARLAADVPESAAVRGLAVAQAEVARRLSERGDLRGARTAFEAALVVFEQTAARDPEDRDYQFDILLVHLDLATTLLGLDELGAAADHALAATAVAERLSARDPENTLWRGQLAASQLQTGKILMLKGDTANAVRAFETGVAAYTELARKHPDDLEMQHNLKLGHQRLAEALETTDATRAVAEHRAALAIAEQLLARDPSQASFRDGVVRAHLRSGETLRKIGKISDAVVELELARGLAEKLLADVPDDASAAGDVADAHDFLGRSLAARGDVAAAKAELEAALAAFEHLHARHPDVDVTDDLAAVRQRIGALGRAK